MSGRWQKGENGDIAKMINPKVGIFLIIEMKCGEDIIEGRL